MVDAFLLRVLLSFVAGGVFVATIIWVSEKFGSKIGGLIGGLPSTLLISLAFIAWTQGPAAAVSAVPIVPVALSAASLFLVAFIFLYRYGRYAALAGAVLLWFALALPLVVIRFSDLALSLLLSSAGFGTAIFLLRKFPHRKLAKYSYTWKEMLLRIFIAGAVVATAVFLSKALGPLWGGLFGSFPAAFSAIMFLVSRAHGIEFASSVARTLPYGSIVNVIFAVSFFFLVPVYGIVFGIITSYLLSLISAVLMYYTVLRG